jgi:hypothetical protein
MRAGRDWQAGRLRYLIHFSDGGSGMRHRDEPLDEGDEPSEGGRRYVVDRVEQPPNPDALGHAWARLIE